VARESTGMSRTQRNLGKGVATLTTSRGQKPLVLEKKRGEEGKKLRIRGG